MGRGIDIAPYFIIRHGPGKGKPKRKGTNNKAAVGPPSTFKPGDDSDDPRDIIGKG